jgi:hypothetical protein
MNLSLCCEHPQSSAYKLLKDEAEMPLSKAVNTDLAVESWLHHLLATQSNFVCTGSFSEKKGLVTGPIS